MAWSTVAKPGAQTYTTVNPMGKETYDQASLTYDEATIYYDGINPSQWTDVPKPTGTTIILAGMATGLITPPTYSREIAIDSWVKVAKPNTP